MGETRVDLLHLLEDLRDAYPGPLEETILTEIMANALDSGASVISFACDPTEHALTIIDNGSGMQRRDLARFHDIASSSKIRGHGIGFAGVGIKLGLLICEAVLTETQRGKTHIASAWHMASRHRAPWKWVPPVGRVHERGTAVRLTLRNPLSPLLDPGFLEATLRRHFQPLLDPTFNDFLNAHYTNGIEINVNQQRLMKQHWIPPLRAPMEIRLLRKRKPSAIGYLFREDKALPEDQRGIAISTFGKVIRRGWDWLGMTFQGAERIGGLIEVPELAASLTLNKGDFIRTGTRGATYLAFRKAIQQAVSRQLAEWGDAPATSEEAPPREVRPLQRDLAYLLEDLAMDFPLLSSLVEQRAGGQKRLPLGSPGGVADGRSFVAASFAEFDREIGTQPQREAGVAASQPETATVNEPPAAFTLPEHATQLPGQSNTRRHAHYGLDIQFEDRSDDPNLGRLLESTIWVNRTHPAYRRALISRSIGYHIALTVAMALAPLAVEPAQQSMFLLSFLTRWGEALDKASARRRANRP
ncbi:MAG TPA: ATP-binding protein [Candidatus Binatia bacterium]